MSLSLGEIKREIGQLSREERDRLIGFLIAGLEPTDEGDIEAAREEEVHARSREVQEGRVVPISADEALARVRRSLL